MSAQGKWKLLGVAILAVAILGGAVGWQQFTPKPIAPITITTTSGTITVAPTTVTAAQTTSFVAQTSSVKISPLAHLLPLLESKGTEPYLQLARELQKLPEVTNMTTQQNSTDQRTLEAVGRIVKVVLESDRLDLISLENMLAEGIPAKRKLCTPLQAWLWVAYDKKDYNPLKGYSLDELLTYAWLVGATSNYFNSNRWSYEEARDRVNSPALVNWFINQYLAFDWARNDVHPQDARMTYNIRRGVCRHGAYVALDFLASNGYDAKGVSIAWAPNEGHSVTCVKLENGIFIVVNFRSTRRNPPIVGPFKTYDDVAQHILKESGYTILHQVFVEDLLPFMRRNRDIVSS